MTEERMELAGAVSLVGQFARLRNDDALVDPSCIRELAEALEVIGRHTLALFDRAAVAQVADAATERLVSTVVEQVRAGLTAEEWRGVRATVTDATARINHLPASPVERSAKP